MLGASSYSQLWITARSEERGQGELLKDSGISKEAPSLQGKGIRTTVYVKMDTSELLLLPEGVCRQLGLITSHNEVCPVEREKSKLRGTRAQKMVTM